MWTWVLADLNGNDLGEMVNADARTITWGLSRTAVATWTVRWDFPWLENLVGGDLSVRCYDHDHVLRFHGILHSVEFGTDEMGITVQCTASDPSYRLSRRLAGKSANGTSFTTTDRADLVRQLIATANSDGNTGIDTTNSVSAASAITYVAGPYKPIATILMELCQAYDGFDWRIDPQERDGSGRIGDFFATSLIGDVKADSVFEYGGTKSNVTNFTYQRDWSTLANRVFHIVDEGSASVGTPVVTSTAALGTASIAARGIYEDIAEAGGLTDVTTRQSLVDAHVDTRSEPRKVFSFNPNPDTGTGRVPEFNNDYSIGDSVRVRVNQGETNLIDGYVRVYQMQLSIDSEGMETFTPVLVDEEAAPA